MITKLQVKYIQSLGQKKLRDEAQVFVAEGPKIINELLGAGPASLVTLFATAQWIAANALLIQQLPAAAVNEVTSTELERLSFQQTPHDVLGVFKKPAPARPDFSNKLSLMLDGIQDPGNMGTLIRIADWFGVSNIVCSPDCADGFAPKVVQASMGSIVRVQLLYTDLVELVSKTKGLALYAAALRGENLHAMPPLKEGIIVIGNESKGISQALLNCCRHRVTIPRIGHAESLNAAVAAGIILSHLTPGPSPPSA